jgi:hypothetical protein
MNNFPRLALTVILGDLSLIAFVVVVRALFPARAGRTQQIAEGMPGRAFLVGLINFLFFGAIALLFSALADRLGNELPRLPMLVIAAALSVGLSFGLAGVAQLVGERVAAQARAVRQTLWGTLALSLACALPFVGWFLLLPYAGLLGLGAFIIGFFYKPPTT